MLDARDSDAPNSLTLEQPPSGLESLRPMILTAPHEDPNDRISSSRFPQTEKIENCVLHFALRDQVKKNIEMIRALVDVSIKFYISSQRRPMT